METPDNLESQIQKLSEESINLDSAENLVKEMDDKIAEGEALSLEDKERVKEKLTDLREVQEEIDAPEIRNMIFRLSGFLFPYEN